MPSRSNLFRGCLLDQTNRGWLTTLVNWFNVSIHIRRVISAMWTIRTPKTRWFSTNVTNVLDYSSFVGTTTRALQTLILLRPASMINVLPNERIVPSPFGSPTSINPSTICNKDHRFSLTPVNARTMKPTHQSCIDKYAMKRKTISHCQYRRTRA